MHFALLLHASKLSKGHVFFWLPIGVRTPLGVICYWLFVNRKWLKIICRTHLKNVDKGSWQGADRRKSGAYTIVCEHFEPGRNTAISN
jgi:hypothetical protein